MMHEGDYLLGLDIGTDSIGWAVTDEDYNILQFKNKAMWGIHLFESGKTAEERRVHRTARRRLERRNVRIRLLRELFSHEISKADQGFYERLDESWKHLKDKRANQKNTLFNDPEFKDKDFHKKYPTVYHLRLDLMNTKEKPDIRLIYLAVHHIIKYRGHFLFKGLTDEDIPEFDILFRELLETVNDECGFTLNADNISKQLEEIVTNANLGVKEKGQMMQEQLGAEEPGEKELLALIAGSRVSMSKLFGEEIDLKSFSFRDPNYDDSSDEYADMLGPDRAHIIGLCKSIYDRSVLARVLSEYNTISEAKTSDYERHKNDLRTLKWAVRTYAPDKYYEVFKSERTENNYCTYVKEYGNRTPEKKSSTQEAFCDYIRKKVLNDIPEETVSNDPILKDMFARLGQSTFMPKQTVKDNSVVPYTVHRKELIKILDNVSVHYPFLNETDNDGLSVKDKILKINEFRIPYYVGPLNKRAGNFWAVRRSEERITPWNFDKVVDLDGSAIRFIDELTNTCTYLDGEKVLPKNSLLYSKFELYNELNNMQINKDRIDPKLKNEIVRDLFENIDSVKKITLNDIRKYLKTRGLITDACEITGIDSSIKSNLRSYVLIKKIVGSKISDRKMTEDLIRTITVFGDERSRVYKKLKDDHGSKLTDTELKGLSRLQFKDWGRLSEKLLTGLYHQDKGAGLSGNIMTYLEQTQDNFMQILNKYSFLKLIDLENESLAGGYDGKIKYGLVEGLSVSPAVRRGIWRALDVIQDILNIMKKPPAKLFVETTREVGEKGKRTESRKAHLEKLFRECKKDLLENEEEKKKWRESIDGEDEGKLKGRSLFLYYLQHGKCMYCSKPLNISDIGNNEAVDRDHLYPQSKIKDDSIHNNMVLVCRECNQKKGDRFPLSSDIQNKQSAWWGHLKDCGFITPEKYARLTRRTELSEEELAKFIDRQIVETSQSVKGVITVLGRTFPDSDIVYVKGRNVSEFRQENDFVKCRIVNDYHHAKDAYLNIVVGNAYDTKFTKNFKEFIKSDENYNLRRMYDFDISRNGKTAWVAGDSGTISTVRKYMRRNNIQFTRFATEAKGGFFDQNLLKKSENLFRPKDGLAPEDYGGYDNVKGAYFTLIKYKERGKNVSIIRPVPIYLSKTIENNPEILRRIMDNPEINDVDIAIEKIKYNSLLEIDGFRGHISARTGNSLRLKCGIQLILPDELYKYCKKIAKYTEDRKNRETYPVGSYGFMLEGNISLYDHLLTKAKSSIYSVMLNSTLAKNMSENRDKFVSSEIDIQVRVLNNILYSFQCNSVITDLKEIGAGKTGILDLNTKISGSNRKISLIFQSPSGLFEKRVELN